MNFFIKIFELFTTEKYMESIWEGLKLTLSISVLAALLGLVLGVMVALVGMAKNSWYMRVPKLLCKLYITIIRGTPMALQLFIMAYVIFAIRGFPLVITATIAFGVNSGAYVAENIRAGILSVDIGQTEAGRALGLSGGTTMLRIVIPQAIKNVLPAIGNEFISLLKETSVIGFLGVIDLTKAAQRVISRTADPYFPYIAIALAYLAMVCILNYFVKLLEKRLAKSDRT